MAFTPCSSLLTASVIEICGSPRIKGYEQIGIIVNRDDVDWTAVAYNATNSRIVETFALVTGKKPFAIYQPKNSPTSFNGTQTSFKAESDSYDKTVQFYFEGIGGAAAANVVEPLKGGDYVIIIPRKDHRGDGSFQIFGIQSGMKASAQVQTEDTGYWLITMTGNEPSAEISLFSTSYATTKTAYDAIVATIV
mgnify:FL=1